MATASGPFIEYVGEPTVEHARNGDALRMIYNQAVRINTDGFIPVVTWPCHDEPAELCPWCGALRGHGTLWDFRRAAPHDGTGRSVPSHEWRRFAERHKCPRCRTYADRGKRDLHTTTVEAAAAYEQRHGGRPSI